MIYGNKNFYGYEIGVLLLNTKFPRIKGDVGNVQSYNFPVLFEVVEEANIQNVILNTDRSIITPFIKAAKKLEEKGVKAITTSCGFTIMFQDDIAKELRVPFFSSSLLLLPLLQRIFKSKILILTANSKNLTKEYLKAAGASNFSQIIVKGMEDQPEFKRVILDNNSDMNLEKIEEEIKNVVRNTINDEKDIGCILLECHNLPPFKSLIQKEVNIPVYDIISFVNFIYSGIIKTNP
ncbi:MAG: aspartate/glutamate racemase family protein [Thermoplasmata archaeon]